MTLELITRTSDLPALASEWNALAMRANRDGAFRSFDWYWNWLHAFAASVQPHVYVARDLAGKAVAIAPFASTTFRDHGLSFRALSFGGRDTVSGDFLDLLVSDDLRFDFTQEVLDELQRSRDWDLALFGEMVEGSSIELAMAQWVMSCGYTHRYQEHRLCSYVLLPSTWEGYLSSLGPNFRSNLRKKSRFEALGAEISEWSEPDDLVRELAVLIELHVARWSSEGDQGTLWNPCLQQFLHGLCSYSKEAVLRPRMFTLRHESKTIASLLTFRFGSTSYFYQCGWDRSSPLAKFRPMVVLLGESIRRSIEDGLSFYEMLRGDHAYKLRFAPLHRNTVTLCIGRSARARAYIAALQTHDFFSKFTARTKPALTTAETE